MSVAFALRPAAVVADGYSTPDGLLEAAIEGVGRLESRRSGEVEDVSWASATVTRAATGEVLVIEVHAGPSIAELYGFEVVPELAVATIVTVQLTGDAKDWSWSEAYINRLVERLSATVLT